MDNDVNESRTTFDIQEHLLFFIEKCPYYAYLSRSLSKVCTRKVQTIEISYNKDDDNICICYNPDFMSKWSPLQIRGLLIHELNHMSLGHLTLRSFHEKKYLRYIANIAFDLANNSLIKTDIVNFSTGYDLTNNSKILPDGGCFPGEIFTKFETETEENYQIRLQTPLAKAIASFPKLKAAEWYFENLKLLVDEEECEGSDVDYLVDDHDSWEKIPEDLQNYFNAKVRNIVEKAIAEANLTPNGWGNMSVNIKSAIENAQKIVIDWKHLLKYFIGSLNAGGRTSSLKRINRKYPLVHPGVKKNRVPKLLIARDESGSVSMKMFKIFTNWINTLTQKIDIEFVPFDTECLSENVVKWNKNAIPREALVRIKSGGTDFNAPSMLFDAPENRNRWDGLIILTDGQAPKPVEVRKKRAWVLVKNGKLDFQTSDLQVNIVSH